MARNVSFAVGLVGGGTGGGSGARPRVGATLVVTTAARVVVTTMDDAADPAVPPAGPAAADVLATGAATVSWRWSGPEAAVDCFGPVSANATPASAITSSTAATVSNTPRRRRPRSGCGAQSPPQCGATGAASGFAVVVASAPSGAGVS